MSAIFRTTSQALSFSYLVQNFEAAPESQLAKELRKHLAMLGEGRRSTVDFGGLNPLEIRGQCALVRSAVNSKLTKHESDVVKARYGTVMREKAADGSIVTIVPEERRLAILGVADYMHQHFDSIPKSALAYMVSRAVGNVATMRAPFKTIEQLHGGSHTTMCRSMPKLLDKLAAIDARAVDKLTPIFERDGLVESPCMCAA